jgi:hypothetical protein
LISDGSLSNSEGYGLRAGAAATEFAAAISPIRHLSYQARPGVQNAELDLQLQEAHVSAHRVRAAPAALRIAGRAGGGSLCAASCLQHLDGGQWYLTPHGRVSLRLAPGGSQPSTSRTCSSSCAESWDWSIPPTCFRTGPVVKRAASRRRPRGLPDRGGPGHPKHRIGTVDQRWDPVELVGADLVACGVVLLMMVRSRSRSARSCLEPAPTSRCRL